MNVSFSSRVTAISSENPLQLMVAAFFVQHVKVFGLDQVHTFHIFDA